MKNVLPILVCTLLIFEPAYGQPRNDISVNCETVTLEGECLLFGVSIIQLLANPDDYDGKNVRLIGYIHFEFEGAGIYFHKEDFDRRIYANGFWVSLAQGFSPDHCQDRYVLIEGVFDASSTGHMGLWSGTVKDITRCTQWPP